MDHKDNNNMVSHPREQRRRRVSGPGNGGGVGGVGAPNARGVKKRPEILCGQVIAGRYRIQKFIGKGGMGATVWEAVQASTKRLVAVKVLASSPAHATERFKRECRLAAKLNHRHIATVHDFGQTEDGRLYLVMELLRGRTLRDLMAAAQPLEPFRALSVADQILRGLEHAHNNGIVHRDLKPDNVFLAQQDDRQDYVKIFDFGLAKYFTEVRRSTTGTDLYASSAATICGTPTYMAPEQIAGDALDARTDLYALGILLYEMLTGACPFDTDTNVDVFVQHLSHPPIPMDKRRPDVSVPKGLQRVVYKAIAKDPAERFQSAVEMRRVIREHAYECELQPVDLSMPGTDLMAVDSFSVNPNDTVPDMPGLGYQKPLKRRAAVFAIAAAVSVVVVAFALGGYWLRTAQPQKILADAVRPAATDSASAPAKPRKAVTSTAGPVDWSSVKMNLDSELKERPSSAGPAKGDARTNQRRRMAKADAQQKRRSARLNSWRRGRAQKSNNRASAPSNPSGADVVPEDAVVPNENEQAEPVPVPNVLNAPLGGAPRGDHRAAVSDGKEASGAKKIEKSHDEPSAAGDVSPAAAKGADKADDASPKDP